VATLCCLGGEKTSSALVVAVLVVEVKVGLELKEREVPGRVLIERCIGSTRGSLLVYFNYNMGSGGSNELTNDVT
jgi:hypothetical protein